MTIGYGVLCPDHLGEVNAFYKETGYKGMAMAEDLIFAAVDDARIVGVVRICREHDHRVLRGMRVAMEYRGRRVVGPGMLVHVLPCMEHRDCWGIAYPHLERFYGTVGFRFVPANTAPPHLQERLMEYGGEATNRIMLRRQTH